MGMKEMAKDLSRYAMKGQAGMAVKGIGKAISSLQGCSGANPMENESGPLFRKGDNACLMTSGGKQMVKLLEDVDPEALSARAEFTDGRITMVDVSMLSQCGEQEDDDEESDGIKIIIQGGRGK